MSEIVILSCEEYEKLRRKYINEHLFDVDLKPFFQSGFPVIKDYVYYDDPIIVK